MSDRRMPFSLWPCVLGLFACLALSVTGFVCFRNAAATARSAGGQVAPEQLEPVDEHPPGEPQAPEEEGPHAHARQ
jgi:hypothetical protein